MSNEALRSIFNANKHFINEQINFFFLLNADPWQDLEDAGGKGGYKRLTAFKNTHKHLKVLLAIGG